jgi:hypothetical protein
VLSEWIRVLRNDNSVITDYSIESSMREAFDIDINSTNEYIYIGQTVPFNNFFVEVGTVNTNASVVSVQYWTQNRTWQDAVDVLDATKVAGVPFARSGVIQFSPHYQHRWGIVRTDLNAGPSELSTTHIYHTYWARIKVSASLSAGTTAKRIGYMFCDSTSIKDVRSDIDNYLFTGQTDWTPQIITASRYLVGDLRSQGLVAGNGNILRLSDVSEACKYLTAYFIFAEMGADYNDTKNWAFGMDKSALSSQRYSFDQNEDGMLDEREIGTRIGMLTR